MSGASSPYTEPLLAHARAPRRQGLLPPPAVTGRASNRLCGDEVRISLRQEGDHIAAFGFQADACAITVAAASMLGDAAVTRSPSALADLGQAFSGWLTGVNPQNDDIPDAIRCSGLDAFADLRTRPSRQRCALLPFEAMADALQRMSMNRDERDA